MWTRALCLIALVGASACGSDVDDRPVSWNYIYAAIVVPNCTRAACHSALTRTAGNNFSVKAIARESLKTADTLNMLKGVRVDYLRMPPDQPLPNADIDLIERWQDAGLPD